jgi:hypothetical protein
MNGECRGFEIGAIGIPSEAPQPLIAAQLVVVLRGVPCRHLKQWYRRTSGITTTNYKETGLFLPPDDRRNDVQWSERQPGDFKPEEFQPKEFTPQQASPTFWDWMWDWYESQNGYAHIAAYLAQLDISKFNPKASPPKTEAFWAIVNANRPREENELAELLLAMGQPAATTLALIEAAPIQSMKLQDWLNDSRNRRVIPKHMKSAGYESVHNPDSDNGLWRINGVKQVVYAREGLTVVQRIAAARDLKAVEEARAAKAKAAPEDTLGARMEEAARGFNDSPPPRRDH